MARPTRFKEHPKLLVDLSKKVSEDLGIDTPQALASLPSLKAATGPKAAGLKARSLMASSLGIAGTVGVGRTKAARTISHRPSPTLARKIAAKIIGMFPDDGEVICSITHAMDPQIGGKWVNECDHMFWVASEYQVLQSVYEWMNSEYEAILEQIDYDIQPIELMDGKKAWPDAEALCTAWDNVANDQGEILIVLEVEDAEGIPCDSYTTTSDELIGRMGLSREDLIPHLVIADSVLPDDHVALYHHDDDEVFLDEGYVVTGVVRGEEYTCIHINPA